MKPEAPKPEGNAGFSSSHLSMLERYGGKRGRQIVALAALAQLAAPAVKFAWEHYHRREDFTITVAGTDEIYPDLHGWVLERIPRDHRKALIAATAYNSPKDKYELPEKMKDGPHIQLRYDGSRTQDVTIDGHKVVVAVEREPVPERVSLPENWRQFMEKITFTATDTEGRDAVARMLSGLLASKQVETGPPALFMPSRWGSGWSRRGDLPPREIDSVILKRGQLERLSNDLSRFLASEDDYSRTSQPWHRGYLFHGAPGTGKTSIARALANHFNLATYYLPLGDVAKDTDLLQLVAEIQPRSVLLIEDCDVFHASTNRDTDEKDKSSVAGMLNALDGVWTPHGLITILTTNEREQLDPALIRPGRVDVDEEFTVLDQEQAQRLIDYFEADLEADPFVDESPSFLIARAQHVREKAVL